MAFFDNKALTEIQNPDGSGPIFITTPVESMAWNSTPATWTDNVTTNTTPSVTNSSTSNSSTVVTGVSQRGRDVTTTNKTTTNTETTRRIQSSSESENTQTTISTASVTTSSIIPYMRAKRIIFEASGMKPNAKVIARFADEIVTDRCTQTSSTRAAGKLVVEPTGYIKGYFDLPGSTFKVGERIFKLEDETDAELSSAFTKYIAIGEQLDTMTTTTTDTVITQQKTIKDETFIQNTTTTNVFNTSRRVPKDPVAQSFYVDTAQTNIGVFIHSVDLFFFEVDPAHEVLVELRRMKNGYPTLDLIQSHSYTKLPPSLIKRSNNGTVPTRFVFETPVFLPASEEYCFVVLSNSEKTSIWCSELGKKAFTAKDSVAPSGEIISKQPYLGTMFISQNNSTWDAQQLRDVKFTINRCKFTKNVGTATYVNDVSTDVFNFPNKKFMAPNALEFTKSSNSVWLYAHGHGLIIGDVFRLNFHNDGLTTMFGIAKNLIENVPLTVTAVTATKIKFTVSKAAAGSGSSGGSGMWMDGWVTAYSSAQLIKKDLALDGTTVTYNLSGKLQNNFTALPSGNNPLISNKIVDLKNIYAVKQDNDKGAVITSKITTSSDMISPIIYSDSIGIEGHLNIVNNVDYTNAAGVKQEDSSPAKYIQREVTLINPANELKIFFESSMPYGSNVSVYYKTGVTDISPETEWTKMVPDAGGSIHSAQENDWRSQKYTKSLGAEFDIFQIMLVLYSDSRLVIPKVKNYRAIALNA